MSDINKKTYDLVVKAIGSKDFREAQTLLLGKESVRDVHIARAFYHLYSAKKSPVSNSAKAKERLEQLCSFDCKFGYAEKGRCQLFGVIYEKDTLSAEDNLVKAGESQHLAVFYRAEIHFNGYHKEANGESIYDYEEASRLYKYLMKNGNERVKNSASLQYAKLLMKVGDLSSDKAKMIHDISITLIEAGLDEARDVYADYLMSMLKHVVGRLLDTNEMLEENRAKLGLDVNRRKFSKAIGDIESVLHGDTYV